MSFASDLIAMWWCCRREPHTGDHWDFTWHDWVSMTMSEPTLRLLDPARSTLHIDPVARDAIADCEPGARLTNVLKYDTMAVHKGWGMVNVGSDDTEIQWWTADGQRRFLGFNTIDKYVSLLIVFSLALDVCREEVARSCAETQQNYDLGSQSSSPTQQTCSWASAAEVAYTIFIIIDLILLVVFLVELCGRMTLKYIGLRNVYAYVLRVYNARYRKQGQESFKKNGIRRNDPERSKQPWFRTLYVAQNEQLRKDYSPMTSR